MIDIKELIDGYFKSAIIRDRGDYIIVTPHFFHIESDESIALKFSQTEDGRPVITDCGTTKDYLEITNINIKDYREKLETIKERFFIEEDENGAFFMIMPTDSLPAAYNYIGYFIQAISIIANIDL